MDLQLPTVPGVDAIRAIVEESPHVKVVVLSASGEEPDVLEAVKVGATGYLLKGSTAGEIVNAVRRVRDGEPVFTPSLAGMVLSEFRRVAAPDPGVPGLTPRENEVLSSWRRVTHTERSPASCSSRSRPSRTTSRTSSRSSSFASATS